MSWALGRSRVDSVYGNLAYDRMPPTIPNISEKSQNLVPDISKVVLQAAGVMYLYNIHFYNYLNSFYQRVPDFMNKESTKLLDIDV